MIYEIADLRKGFKWSPGEVAADPELLDCNKDCSCSAQECLSVS
eukprot:COSAG02_NODE_47267_length_342_cov_1.049383_1_plen_43_part_01